MNRDTVIELAREAGYIGVQFTSISTLERFAALVAAHEREECAKVVEAEQVRVLDKQEGESWDSVNINIRMTAVLLPDIAAAIRSRP
jgi:hypothetical protein